MASNFKLYGYWRSAATYRVRIALSLKGLSWEETSVDLMAGEQFTGEFADRNPQHSVPVLYDGSAAFTQSLAIIEYLDERYPDPPLLPRDAAERAAVRSFALISIADAHPLQTPRVRRWLGTQLSLDETSIRRWVQHWFQEGFAAMEARLESRQTPNSKYCFGDAPSLADIALAAHSEGASFVDVSCDDYPRLAAVMRNCQNLDAFLKNKPSALRPDTEQRA